MVADTETPVSALLKLTQPGRGDFLLESVEGGAARGRYSLIGLDPDLVFRANGRTAEINSAWQVDRGLCPLRRRNACRASQAGRLMPPRRARRPADRACASCRHSGL